MFYNPIRLRRVNQEYGPVRTLREQASTTPPHFVFPTSVPPRLPNLNAFAKHWIRSVKEEALSRMILFGERSLQHVLKEYEHHFHRERPHQAKENIILMPSARQAHSSGGQICCRERLGRDKTALMAPYEFGVWDMAPMSFFIDFADNVVRWLEAGEDAYWFWLFSGKSETVLVFAGLGVAAQFWYWSTPGQAGR